MSYHGLTEQVPRQVFVLTTARAVPRGHGGCGADGDAGFAVGGTVYRFIRVVPERFFGIEEVWVGESRVHMTDPERTLLDGLSRPRYCGGFAEVLRAFEVRLARLEFDRIVAYALRTDGATVKRLGWVLERLGIDRGRLEPLRRVEVKGYRPLDPTGPCRGPCDKVWKIQVNLPSLLNR